MNTYFTPENTFFDDKKLARLNEAANIALARKRSQRFSRQQILDAVVRCYSSLRKPSEVARAAILELESHVYLKTHAY